ncbi:MAG: O-antigen ligase family protein [Bradyrhizobium sp.]|uniref:O-antigen ligase family protein n=1 Tax=Bradyrhizobium sp. TaxID=376 RepID=UPI0025BDEEAE|nr:O-antigen ligase [Bradyrhizobium sp.]MBI5264071.1 O-antigen ligase family protein [Bradyrhizobium sp.]
MSELVTSSEFRAVLSGMRRQQVMDIVRGAAFIGAVLLAWISLRPFVDLGDQQLKDTTTGNEAPTYITFGCLAVMTVALAMRDNMRGIATLLSPPFMLFAAWLAITVVLSLDPGTSIRRVSLTVCVIGVAAAIMLLPKSQHELMRWFSVAALVLLVVCYLGILFAPQLSIHLASDTQEPQLAGDWRGAFGHKNMAAGIMAMLLFIGIYIVRSGAWISGVAILALASVFLLNTSGKSAPVLAIAVLVVTSLTSIVRSYGLRMVMLVTPLVVLNLLSIGTVISPLFAELVQHLPLDTSFTGRTDIWTFALQSLQERLPTGYGFAAFWGSDTVRSLPEGKEWAETASHSHNGYLDTALGMGLPGLLLLIFAVVITPLRDFQLADEGGNNGPLAMALLRIWLFGLYLSSLESFFLDRSDPLWFTFLLAVFGLHYLARFKAVG